MIEGIKEHQAIKVGDTVVPVEGLTAEDVAEVIEHAERLKAIEANTPVAGEKTLAWPLYRTYLESACGRYTVQEAGAGYTVLLLQSGFDNYDQIGECDNLAEAIKIAERHAAGVVEPIEGLTEADLAEVIEPVAPIINTNTRVLTTGARNKEEEFDMIGSTKVTLQWTIQPSGDWVSECGQYRLLASKYGGIYASVCDVEGKDEEEDWCQLATGACVPFGYAMRLAEAFAAEGAACLAHEAAQAHLYAVQSSRATYTMVAEDLMQSHCDAINASYFA